MYSASRTVNHLGSIKVIKQIVRCHRNFVKRQRVVDPGIQRRKSLLDNDEQELQELNDYEFDLEADFMNVGKTHAEYEHEVKLHQEKEKYLIVKQKYFKNKLPNFLTWSDKQQIRYLYNKDPEEWTIEKLSDGFPALPEVIAKIATSTWTKRESKIENHDESVKRNWLLFKEGKLTHLPADLTEHLNKFTSRELNLKPFEVPEEMKVNHNKSMLAPNIKMGTEFLEIIKSYERLKNKDNSSAEQANVTNKNKIHAPPKEDTYLLHGNNRAQYSTHITLNLLQNKIVQKAKEGKVSAAEEVIVKELKEEPHSEHAQDQQLAEPLSKVTTLIPSKHNEKISTSLQKPDKALYLFDYPQKITIPKSKLKRGYTYKLNDCYYDDDGEFLYRVPGMYK